MVRVAVTTIAAFVQLSLLAQHSFGLPIQSVDTQVLSNAGIGRRSIQQLSKRGVCEALSSCLGRKPKTKGSQPEPARPPRQDDPGLIVAKGPHHPTPPPSPHPAKQSQEFPTEGHGSQPSQLHAEGSRQNAVSHSKPTEEERGKHPSEWKNPVHELPGSEPPRHEVARRDLKGPPSILGRGELNARSYFVEDLLD